VNEKGRRSLVTTDALEPSGERVLRRQDIVDHWKKQAEINGVDWIDVSMTYRWLRMQQRAELAPLINLRKAIWAQFPGTAKLTYKYAFTEGDRTLIPRWDEVATAVCMEFGINPDDAAEYIWDVARKDKPQPPSVEETYAQAIDICLEGQASFNPGEFSEASF